MAVRKHLYVTSWDEDRLYTHTHTHTHTHKIERRLAREKGRVEEKREDGRKEGKTVYRLPGAETEVGGRHGNVAVIRVIRIRRGRRAVSRGRPDRPTTGRTDTHTQTQRTS